MAENHEDKPQEKEPQNEQEKVSLGSAAKQSVDDILHKIGDKETIEKGKDLLKYRKFEVIIGIILIVAMIFSIFFHAYGSIVVGLISGLVLSCEFVRLLGKCICYYREKLVFKVFTAIVLTITTIIVAPAIVVSTFVGVGIRWILQPKRHCLCHDTDSCKCCSDEDK